MVLLRSGNNAHVVLCAEPSEGGRHAEVEVQCHDARDCLLAEQGCGDEVSLIRFGGAEARDRQPFHQRSLATRCFHNRISEAREILGVGALALDQDAIGNELAVGVDRALTRQRESRRRFA